MHGNVSLAKGTDPSDPLRNLRLNSALSDLASGAGLPLLSSSKVHLGDVELPEISILPSAQTAFQRALHVALIKRLRRAREVQ